MNFTWIESLSLFLGLVMFVVYLCRCRTTRTKATLPAALVCILSASPIVYGLVLIPRPWVPFLQEIPMQPPHQVLAGVALAWIGWDFIRGVWQKPGNLEVSGEPSQASSANAPTKVTERPSLTDIGLTNES